MDNINGKAGIDYELLIVFVRRRMPSTYNANQHNLFPGNPRQMVYSQNFKLFRAKFWSSHTCLGTPPSEVRNDL